MIPQEHCPEFIEVAVDEDGNEIAEGEEFEYIEVDVDEDGNEIDLSSDESYEHVDDEDSEEGPAAGPSVMNPSP